MRQGGMDARKHSCTDSVLSAVPRLASWYLKAGGLDVEGDGVRCC